MVNIKIKSISGNIPAYETSGSAGMDIKATIAEDIILEPGARQLVPTGLFIELPVGYEAQIRARSGMAIKNGICLINGIGTIDSDYRGELMVPLVNLGQETFTICNGERIAQMVIAKYEQAIIHEVEILGETKRGSGGFGHTGK